VGIRARLSYLTSPFAVYLARLMLEPIKSHPTLSAALPPETRRPESRRSRGWGVALRQAAGRRRAKSCGDALTTR
jgi:hypothetical protein